MAKNKSGGKSPYGGNSGNAVHGTNIKKSGTGTGKVIIPKGR